MREIFARALRCWPVELSGAINRKKDVNGLAVDGVKVDPFTAPPKRDDETVQSLELSVRDGDPVADAGTAQLFPIEKDFDHRLALNTRVISGKDLRQFSQDGPLGFRL